MRKATPANKGKIALLHYTCPPVVGGVEAVMAAHARLLARDGYEVKIIAGRGPAPEFELPGISALIEPLIDSKQPRLQMLNGLLDSGQLPADFQDFTADIYRQLSQELQGYAACIVHNAFTLHKNLPLTAALHRLAADLPQVNFIAWCHDLAWTNELYAPVLYNAWPWNLLRQAAAGVKYVAISPQRQQEIVTSFLPPPALSAIPVIANGIAMADFLKLGQETLEVLKAAGLHSLAETKPLLLLPARITRRKNIELGIYITAELKRQRYVPRLLVTGPPGPHNPKNDDYVRELVALRAELKVEAEVIFLMEVWQESSGKPRTVTDEVVADLYRVADALFFPSTQEGFGIPLLEAGLTRLPIFCTRLQPFTEIAGDLPYYFEPGDKPELIAGMIINRLDADRQYKLRRLVIENYTWESIFGSQIKPLLEG